MPLDDGTDLYDDPALYDLEHAGYAGDLHHYTALCQRLQAHRVLELGCGTGRLLVPLLGLGRQVTGIDCAPAMLDACRARLAALEPALQAGARLQLADLRSYRGDLGGFDLVIAAFNTLQHVDPGDLDAVFGTACLHLRPGGHLGVDLYAPARELVSGAPIEDVQESRDAHGRLWQVTRRRQLDAATNWLESLFHARCLSPDSAVTPVVQRRLRQYQWSREALVPAFGRHGLVLVAEAGDLDGRPCSATSPRWLAVARCDAGAN